MNLVFPAFGRGSFEGNDLKFEVGGFADGVDAAFVQDDERIRELFKDWGGMVDDPHRIACAPPPKDVEEEVIQSPKAPPKSKQTKLPSTGGWGDPSPSPAWPGPALRCHPAAARFGSGCRSGSPLVRTAIVIDQWGSVPGRIEYE
jgi:hypothetical protein